MKFRWPLNPGYYADNADNYPGAQINPFHCCWRQRLRLGMCGHHLAGLYITMWSGGGGRAMNILPPSPHTGRKICPETFHIYFRVILMQVVNRMFFPSYFCASDRKQCEEKSKMVIIVWLETMWVGCREAGTDRATNENCHSPQPDHGRPQYIWNI